ncbi:hypothetical protein [Aestuariivirga sp.]|uniref:hypothetical protein n=1 Tax=Aestuariivirga sp. TaxID=2650926 RepID=UPI0039E40AB3
MTGARKALLLSGLIASLMTSLAARAQDITSTVSEFNSDTCAQVAKQDGEFAGGWLCSKDQPVPVYFAEIDRHQMTAFGADAVHHCAARQTINGFNYADTGIEWRMQGGKAFAALQLWSVWWDGGQMAEAKPFIVITKIEAGNSCRVATVSAALPDAMTQARDIADHRSQAFNCFRDVPSWLDGEGERKDQSTWNTPCAQTTP